MTASRLDEEAQRSGKRADTGPKPGRKTGAIGSRHVAGTTPACGPRHGCASSPAASCRRPVRSRSGLRAARPTATPNEAKESDTTPRTSTSPPCRAAGSFAHRVDPAAPTSALGEEPADVWRTGTGQRIKIKRRRIAADVVHEFGCRWTAGDDVAEAWAMAPPVTRTRAAAVVVGCRTSPSASITWVDLACRRPRAPAGTTTPWP